jgi:hypothetical protein
MMYDDFWSLTYLASLHSGKPVSEARGIADAALRDFKTRIAAGDFNEQV